MLRAVKNDVDVDKQNTRISSNTLPQRTHIRRQWCGAGRCEDIEGLRTAEAASEQIGLT